MRIARVDAAELRARSAEVEELVRDSVENGASVGFVLPFAEGELAAYVAGVADEVGAGSRIVLVAFEGERIVGMVQLDLVQKTNGLHRAELQKLQVHTTARGRGLGARLMAEAEETARAAGRTLLVLDTEDGSAAELLYRKLGWTDVGIIPNYAGLPDGTLIATRLFYKEL